MLVKSVSKAVAADAPIPNVVAAAACALGSSRNPFLNPCLVAWSISPTLVFGAWLNKEGGVFTPIVANLAPCWIFKGIIV